MSRRHARRRNEDASISFLDVICCGFGAIVLLLVIVKPTQLVVIEESPIVLDGQVRALQERLFEIRGQVTYLETELNAKHEQLGIDQRRVAILRSEFDTLNSRLASVEDESAGDSTEALDLQIAVQSLSREMKRLLAGRKVQNDYIGGIPVDSEYIIFIIDTSGSMFNVAWSRMMKEVINTLNIYPKVKGIQVLNDQGQYMFSTYQGQWIPDSAARRRAIIQRLQTWNAFSNSSPVEGITAAIRRFYDKNKKISLYVLGDDYSGRSVRRVLDIVKSINEVNSRGESLVRIHAVGFPVHFGRGGNNASANAIRYAALMRSLAEQNNGTFVGVNNVR
ncbi:MAG: VWA domain-containing protein [Gammaproteobacteria bacterium]|nr:VWA domain-containing protein [Gammaproteobacteria bacterium]